MRFRSEVVAALAFLTLAAGLAAPVGSDADPAATRIGRVTVRTTEVSDATRAAATTTVRERCRRRHPGRTAAARRARATCRRRHQPTALPPAPTPTTTATPAASPPTAGSTSTGSATDFAFMSTNADGSPARWNPCRPVTWRLDPLAAPPGALQDVQAALGAVGAASGLTFLYAGGTADRPFLSAAHTDGEDLLVGFGTALDYPTRLTGATIGVGGFSSAATEVDGVVGPWEIVSGDIVLRSPVVPSAGGGPGESFVNLVLHEVGHTVGLGHVGATDEIMNPVLSPATPDGLAAGDRAGLAAVGAAGGCFASPVR